MVVEAVSSVDVLFIIIVVVVVLFVVEIDTSIKISEKQTLP